jgi:hypothetical protein
MYQFWRIFFVSSPVGKMHPVRIGQWVEVMCTCFVVQSLPHPAHAIYLLRPVRYEIPESVAAWAIAGGRGNQMPRVEVLINAMLAFLPSAENQGMLQREWFSVNEVLIRRSARGWLRFADEVISGHFFTRHWWTQQREGPFFLLEGEPCETMGRVITRLAQRETLLLRKRIAREETARMRTQLQKAKEIREWKAAQEERDALERREAILKRGAKNAAKSKGAAAFPASEPQGKPKGKPPRQPHPAADLKRPPPQSLTLSSANKQEVERLVHARYAKQTTILAKAKSALSSLRVATLENNFRRVLCLVVSLGHQHPHIKWSVKLALHEAAVETGRSVWDVERELYRIRFRRDANPLEKMVQLVADDHE